MVKKIIPAGLLLITPLIFAPFTLDFFSINKHAFIILIALLLLAITAWTHLTTKKHPHSTNFFNLALIMFGAAISLNIFFTQEAKMESLISKGALLLALSIISYLITTTKKSTSSLRWALTALIISGTLISLHGIFQLTILSELTIIPIWMRGFTFTPAGSVLALLETITISFIATTVWAAKEKNINRKTTLLAMAGVQLATIVAYSLMISRGKITIHLLPIQAGWALTLDALKNVHDLLVGIGLANFPVLFTQAKPTFLAQTQLWSIVFQTNSTEVFQLLTTTGVIGLGSFIYLIIATIKNSFKLEHTPLLLSLKLTTYSLILSFFLVPATVITYTFFFVLAGLIAAQHPQQHKKDINLPGYTSLISTIIISGLIFITSYFAVRVYAAEIFMRQAQIAFAHNDAKQVYAAHIGAVQKMPRIAEYRISLSQINLTLASSLSQNSTTSENGQESNLTQQQRDQISTLIQRAIEQGQIAIKLRPSLYSTWQNMGGIYRNLINVAQGAEDFAVKYLGQAVAKDPANPIIRVEYGGLFYQLAQLVSDEEIKNSLLDQSIQQFQTAIQLKPDYANGYYNLANALTMKGSYRLAYQAMAQTLAYIDSESVDYQQVQQELLDLEKKLPTDPQPPFDQNQIEPETTSDLKQPLPLPSPLPGGLIEIPQTTEQLIPTDESATTSSATTSATPQSSPTAHPSPTE